MSGTWHNTKVKSLDQQYDRRALYNQCTIANATVMIGHTRLVNVFGRGGLRLEERLIPCHARFHRKAISLGACDCTRIVADKCTFNIDHVCVCVTCLIGRDARPFHHDGELDFQQSRNAT